MRARPTLAWVTIGLCLWLAFPGGVGAGDVAPPPTPPPDCSGPAVPLSCAGDIPDAALAPTEDPCADPASPFECADDDLDAIIVAEDRDQDGLTDDVEAEIGSDPDNPDTDGDGLRDGEEAQRGTLFDVADTDGDDASDGFEVQQGTNPLDSADKPAGTCGPDSMVACADPARDSIILAEPTNAPDCDGLDDPFVCADDTADGVILAGDRDGDGLDDATEGVIGTDPDNPDTNGDGVPDGFCLPEYSDTDGDGIKDTAFFCAGHDFDGDGLGDGDELALGTDPLDSDTDDDKVADGVEVKEGKNPLDPTDNPTPEAPGPQGVFGDDAASPTPTFPPAGGDTPCANPNVGVECEPVDTSLVVEPNATESILEPIPDCPYQVFITCTEDD